MKNGENRVCLRKYELQTFKMAAFQTSVTTKGLLKVKYAFCVGRTHFFSPPKKDFISVRFSSQY